MRIAVTSLGCRSNHFDGVAMAARLRERGITVVGFAESADCYLVNTCTVTQRAEVQSRQLVRRARSRNPSARVAAIGCAPQRDPDMFARLSGADYVLGNPEKHSLPEFLPDELDRPRERQIRVSPIHLETEVINFGAWADAGRNRIELKIQEGCDRQCSYCVIPQTRGRPRSVPLEQVKSAVSSLKGMGYREIVFTGTHLGAYGGSQFSYLAAGLREVLRYSDGARIRLSSLEPWNVDEELIEVFRDENALCPHLHLSAQSFSDGILRGMNRPYDRNHLIKIIRMMVESSPEAAVGLDIITGFPGEDQKAFAETCATIENLPIMYLHVFPFSSRPGTAAAGRKRGITEREVKKRVTFLRGISRKKRVEFLSRFLGGWLEVVVENEVVQTGKRAQDSGTLRGMSENFVPVVFPGKGNPREIVRVRPEKICEGRRPYLWGRSELV